MTEKPILILGGSYAGLLAAARLRLEAPQARIVLIANQPHFQQRVRGHEALAGRTIRRAPLAPLLARAGIEFRQAEVTGWHPEQRSISLDADRLEYRALICALGSVGEPPRLAGAEHLWQLDQRQPLDRRAAELRDLAERRGHLLVVGNGPTGVECASELAERLPHLRVSLLGSDEPLPDFCAAARRHARRRLLEIGVQLLRGRATAACGDGLWLDDGCFIGADRVLWCAGLHANPLLQQSGLPLNEDGRLRVGRDLRVEGYDHLWAAGDCCAAPLADGRAQRLACATALPTGGHAGMALADWLQGREPRPLSFAYSLRCVSLGRRDAVCQFTDAHDGALPRWLGGWRAALIKRMLCALVWTAPRWELAFGRRIYRWPQAPRHPAQQHRESA